MLVVEVSMNLNSPIEDIFVRNIGECEDGLYEYEIMDPLAPDERLIEETIKHKREDGYRHLLIKVLQLLESQEVCKAVHKELRDLRRKK